MTTSTPAFSSQEDIPDELLFTEEDLIREERQEHSRRHAVLWFATAGTLVFVGALWFLLLPARFGGGFGVSRTATWTGGTADTAQSFYTSVNGVKDQLDRIEQQEQQTIQQQNAVQAETSRLKASIEAAANANAATNAPQPKDVNAK